jgi:hypothetical protein
MASSSSLIQGISISASDDDEASGKVRVRVRRKRNRPPASARRRFLRRAARWGAPFLLAFLAVSLFTYEYYRLSPFYAPSSPSPPPPRAAGNLTRAADGARKCKLAPRPFNPKLVRINCFLLYWFI